MMKGPWPPDTGLMCLPDGLLRVMASILLFVLVSCLMTSPGQGAETETARSAAWIFLGPHNRSGRITDIEVMGDQNRQILAGSASGGVWKSSAFSGIWQSLSDSLPSLSTGDIAVSGGPQPVIWLGTGENNSHRTSLPGTGVYRSDDGGNTWIYRGLRKTRHIGRILVHPRKKRTLWVAALGELYDYNPERGIFKTTDGGETWRHVLAINSRTGCVDLTLDPDNPDIIYAAAWQRLRKAWNMWETGEGSGMYRSRDGGETWHRFEEGLPGGGRTGRIGLAGSKTARAGLFALVDNHTVQGPAPEGRVNIYGQPQPAIIRGVELYRSLPSTGFWEQINTHSLWPFFRSIGYFFGQVRVDPSDPGQIYLLGIDLLSSQDGGLSFRPLRGPRLHPDHHSLWIDPTDHTVLISGNDGGVSISRNRGKSWAPLGYPPTVQFYRVTATVSSNPLKIYASAQDHGCLEGKVVINNGNITCTWRQIPGGEASALAVAGPGDDLVFCSGIYGDLLRVNPVRGRIRRIRPQAQDNQTALRCNWTSPVILSIHNHRTLFFGAQYLFRSRDLGGHWERISPDLTAFHPAKQGDVAFSTITCIAESPLRPGVIFTGSDDGMLYTTHDNGSNWRKLTSETGGIYRITAIVPSRHHPQRLYVSCSGRHEGDHSPNLSVSTDGGKSWTRRKPAGIARGPINALLEDPQHSDVLYAATDSGVYISVDGGFTWTTPGSGLPGVAVFDLHLHREKRWLFAASFGRGMFMLDVKELESTPGSPFNRRESKIPADSR